MAASLHKQDLIIDRIWLGRDGLWTSIGKDFTILSVKSEKKSRKRLMSPDGEGALASPTFEFWGGARSDGDSAEDRLSSSISEFWLSVLLLSQVLGSAIMIQSVSKDARYTSDSALLFSCFSCAFSCFWLCWCLGFSQISTFSLTFCTNRSSSQESVDTTVSDFLDFDFWWFWVSGF